MRVVTWGLGWAVAVAAVAGSAPSGAAPEEAPAADEDSGPRAHPLYDDGGTLDWRTRIADAMQLAKERRRLIFVEWGRES